METNSFIQSLTAKAAKVRPIAFWAILLCGLGSLPLAGAFLDRSDSEQDRLPRPLPVEVSQVKKVDRVNIERFYSGTVEARRSSDLGFERTGKISEILAEEGEEVEQGSPLAIMDTRSLRLQVRQVQAQLAEAQARLDELKAGPREEVVRAATARVEELESKTRLAEIRLQRRSELLDRQAISKEELDTASFEVRSLQAAKEAAQHELDELLAGTRVERIISQEAVVEQLRTEVATLRLEIDKSTLRAPFNGRISGRLKDEGSVVGIGEPIISIVEASAPQVKVGLPHEVAGELSPGSKLPILVDNSTFHAELISILPELEGTTRSATALLRVSSSPGISLKSGQVARLRLSQEITASGFWLPTSALTRGVQGLWSCTVLENSNLSDESNQFTAQRIDVEILISEEDRVLVRGPLAAGDLVVSSGTNRIAAGQIVEPILNSRG